MKKDKSILNEADGIVNHRNEEKDREYGPFSEGMDRAASIFKGMSGLDVTGEHMYMALIALKFFLCFRFRHSKIEPFKYSLTVTIQGKQKSKNK